MMYTVWLWSIKHNLGVNALATATKPTRKERLTAQAEALEARRTELVDQIYSIAGDNAVKDRKEEVIRIEHQLTRIYCELALEEE